jgi:P27 family predicted phage terminase small subunit
MAETLPKAPAHLSKATREWWRRVVEQYELEEHHVKLLTVACEAWDRMAEAGRILRADGPIVRDRFGMPRKHPAISIEEQARVQFIRALRELDLEGEPNPVYRRKRR